MNLKAFLKTCILLSIIIGVLCVACQSQTSGKGQNSQSKVQNLETFARLYGYARWFHPSDEAQEIDWDKFAILGVRKVENVKSTTELRDTLYALFSPIVQGLQIYESNKPEHFNPDILLSPDLDAKSGAWQHSGVFLDDKPNIYKSLRINTNEIDTIVNATVVRSISNTLHLNGKEVRLSGYFRGEKGSVKLGVASIPNLGNDNSPELSIELSQDWKRHKLTFTMPQETTNILYGVEIVGDAEVWIDEFTFDVNTGGEWVSADTGNMGFEEGKREEDTKPVENWMIFSKLHTVEITDENPYSGKYCLKVSLPGEISGYFPQFGETTKASIGSNLICVVPLVLQTNASFTYPQTDTKVFNLLQSELANISLSRYTSDPYENLASVIIAWNVLQHFFPYFDVIDTDWNKVLSETLESTLKNKEKKDFYITLSEMFAQLEDGHAAVFGEDMYCLPVRTEFIENKIVITASNDSILKRGDIIHTIDRQPVMEALEEKERMISGSPQLRRYRALNILGCKFKSGETHLVIERDGKEESIMASNSRRGSLFFNPVNERAYLSETIIEIESGIYYINLANCTKDEFEQNKDVLASAKAVIYDQRGGDYLGFLQILPYLIKETVTTPWWSVPQTTYPDQKEVKYQKANSHFHPKQPFFKSKSIIINDPTVKSAGEITMDIIDHYNLATTVGESTAGCNGNVNTIKMPCGYYAWFTGMKVLKHDGSQLYLKGFEPNYPVNKTIQAIKEGRDEYLEKALELARQI